MRGQRPREGSRGQRNNGALFRFGAGNPGWYLPNRRFQLTIRTGYINTRSNWSGFSLRDKRGLLLLEIGAAQRHGAA